MSAEESPVTTADTENTQEPTPAEQEPTQPEATKLEEQKPESKPKRRAPAKKKANPSKARKSVEPAQPPTIPGTGLSRAVGADVPGLRKERASAIERQQKVETDRLKTEVDAAKKVGLHEAKIDDEGALAQQKAARDTREANALDGLEGPPTVAPVIEDSPAKIKVVSRREGEKLTKGRDYLEVTSARFVGFNLHLLGEDFPYPGEVVIDIRRNDGQDHQRYSTWTTDGNIDVPLPGIVGIGDYVIHCESLVTQVGEGRDDRLPLIKATDELKLELY